MCTRPCRMCSRRCCPNPTSPERPFARRYNSSRKNYSEPRQTGGSRPEIFMILFVNTRVVDGSGARPYAGEVLVQGNRIAAIAHAGEAPLPRENALVIDGAGATLMPGLTEAHAHLSWPSSVERFVPGMSLPPEDLLLNTARNARVLLDHGFTSAYSGGALGKTLEISIKAQIDSGGMPGPRLIPCSIEREPPKESVYLEAGAVAEHGKGRAAVRAFVKSCAESGARI